MLDPSFTVIKECNAPAQFYSKMSDRPRVEIESDGLLVACDGFLTNFRALASTLELSENVGIEELVRAGWSKWGELLPDKLRGSFLIVVYDSGANEIFAARDPLGVMPAYFSIIDQRFVIGTACRTVRGHLKVDPPIDKASLANFLNGGQGDFDSTFFEGINRLPPAHSLKYKSNILSVQQYWTPKPTSVPPTFAGQVERFRSLFDQSVASRYLKGKSGLLLSGGLDSSMIAGSLAHELGAGSDVIALSMTHNEIVNWSDGPYIAALQKELPFSYLEIPTGAHDPLFDLERYLVALDGPWISFGHSSSFIGKSTLAQEGCSIVLNGHGGDEIVSYGIGRLNELAMASQWWTLWQETRFVAPLYDASRWTILSPYLDHIKPVRKIRNFLKALFKLPKTLVHSPSLITEPALRLVNERFGSTNVQPVLKHDHTERSLHIEGVTTPAFARAFEVMALASAEIGVESIFPFCCRDLVEFSISLPSETKLGGGFTRRIVREVLRNRVPDMIRTRLDKYDFGTAFAIGLTNRPRLADEIVEAYSGVLCELLVPEELQRLASQIQEKGKDVKREDILNIWRVLVAAKWLKIMVPLEE